MVKVKVVEPFRAMLDAPNALMITGGPPTVMLGFEVFPVPRSVEVTCTLLFFTPAVVPVTFTDKVQEVLIARVPAERLTEPEPATAVAAPPQVLANPLGVATTKPAGRISIKSTPVNGMGLAARLGTVKVTETQPSTGLPPPPPTTTMISPLPSQLFPLP